MSNCSKIIYVNKLLRLYESCKLAIRVTYFGFVLIAIGFLIQNPNVNLFYTFKSNIILFIGELLFKIGEYIVMNLPLIFMLNIVCKRENNSSPIIMALLGYFTFQVTLMMFSPQNLNNIYYASGYGINSVFNLSSGTRQVIETGLIGSILVAYATRFSFIYSRYRGTYSLFNVFSKDTAGIIYNILFCFVLGIIAAYTFPILFGYIQRLIDFVGEDLSDPFRIGMYSISDRILSILGLGRIIRYQFWYSSIGGSFSNTLTGQSLLGDVNIWSYIRDNDAYFFGAGRFITPYYVINIFMVPAIFIGILLSVSDRRDRTYYILPIIFAIVLSILAGNPLPLELLLLVTSPMLLLFYLTGVGLVSGYLVSTETFLGFVSNSQNTITAMPGSFADYIINIRNINLIPALRMIFIVGVVAFIACLAVTVFYNYFLAFDPLNSDKSKKLIDNIIAICGGKENVINCNSGLYKIKVKLENPEHFNVEKIQELDDILILESREGLDFELGTASFAIARRINKLIKEDKK